MRNFRLSGFASGPLAKSVRNSDASQGLLHPALAASRRRSPSPNGLHFFGAAVLGVLLSSCSEPDNTQDADKNHVTRAGVVATDYAACIQNVRKRDPIEDVKRDVARGETRPFFKTDAEMASHYAPGLKECSFVDKVSWPEDRRDSVAGYDNPGELNGYPAGRCSLAIANYQIAYNRALARLNPAMVSKICKNKRVAIDPNYPNYDSELRNDDSRAITAK